MKKTCLLFALLLISLVFASAQTSNEKRVFPTPPNAEISEGQYLIQTSDGGYLLTGTSANFTTGNYAIPRLIKLDANLAVQWDKSYLEQSPPDGITASTYSPAYQTADGGYALAVANDSTTTDLLRLDAAGNILWEKDYGWHHRLRMLGVLPDGGFVVSINEIRRLDANGNMLPQPIPIADASAILLSNNDVLTNYNNVNAKRIFQRSDLDGNIIWQTAPIAGLYPITHPAAMPDGGFAVLAVNANGEQFKIHRFDALGNQVSQTPDNVVPTTMFPTNLAVSSTGRYLISGYTVTTRGFVAQFNAAADGIEWSAASPEDGQEHLQRLNAIPTADGWAAGVCSTTGNKFGFMKVGVNTGVFVNQLSGRVANDVNNNCAVELSETGLYYAKVTASNGLETFNSFADYNGNYQIKLPSGDFTLSVQANQPFFSLCPTADVLVSFPASANNSDTRDLPMQSAALIHEISGTLYLDQNDNCLADVGEPALKNWNIGIQASSGVLNLETNSNGEYKAFVPDGAYEVTAYPYNNHFSICTPSTQSLSLLGPDPQTASIDFVAQPDFLCAKMRSDLGSSAIRPCSTATIYASYRNDGTTTANGATMTVSLDPLLTYVSASTTPAIIDGQSLTFNLGDVAASPGNTWNSININVVADCSLNIGNQVCASSTVYPDEDCTQAPNWNGAIVAATGECDNNGTATFKIQNVGNAPNSVVLNYIITEDQIVLLQSTFQLTPGAEKIETVSGSGLPLTIIAQQEPGFPGDTSVVWNILNCGGISGISSGFGGSAGPFTHQECFSISNSFDPNDKDAIPAGHGPDHFVHPGTPLEYRIRFQNTGNDTAFLVVIRDTLSQHFDFGKIEPRSSSHRYEFAQISDSILQFTFKNIMLPDSAANQEGSQGFVEFNIYPKENLANGTAVLNSAAIYFDYNEPVITNTVKRVYGTYVFVKTTEIGGKTSLPVKVYPNPFITETTFEIPEDAVTSDHQLLLLDAAGRTLRSQPFEGNKCLLRRADLPAGVFAWSISAKGQVVAGGTVIAN